MDQAAAEAILQELPFISEHQARMMYAAWEAGDAVVRQRAWQRGKRALKAQHGERLYEAANSAVGRWIRDHATGRTGMPYEVYQTFTDQNRLEVRIAAAPPILDAILGSLLMDSFPEEEFEELMGPWKTAIGDEAFDAIPEPDPSEDPLARTDPYHGDDARP
jgi:hypothetical protein